MCERTTNKFVQMVAVPEVLLPLSCKEKLYIYTLFSMLEFTRNSIQLQLSARVALCLLDVQISCCLPTRSPCQLYKVATESVSNISLTNACRQISTISFDAVFYPNNVILKLTLPACLLPLIDQTALTLHGR